MGGKLRTAFPWKQGEHVAIIGRNGTGKSMLQAALLPNRPYRIIVRTKPDDVQYTDVERVTTLARIRPGHWVYELEPEHEEQRREIYKTMEFVWKTGGWCFCIDELFYCIDTLRLNAPEVGAPIDKLLTQGRSKGITMVNGMQRPARITRFAISEAVHVISFAVEGREAKTIGEATNRRMEETVQRLGMYEFAWYYSKRREVWTGRLNVRSGEIEHVDIESPRNTRTNLMVANA
ncbi:MAG: ATP-binding protein [Candidatus Acidiferrales bacterium]